jgi:molecular chaperone IbpA
MRRYDLTPFQPSFFLDRMLSDFSQPANHASDVVQPQYDVVQTDDNKSELIVAVPGYRESEIEISEENGRLVIAAGANAIDDGQKVYRRGIARDGFRLEFRLPQHVTTQTGSLVDGLLHVGLERVVPEHLQPRRIAINGNQDEQAAA